MAYYFKDIAGQRFGKLVALRKTGKNKKGDITWVCKCDCGYEKIIAGHALRNGSTKTCTQCLMVLFQQGEKRCSICKIIFPATKEYFNRDKSSRIGLSCECKSCTKKIREKNSQKYQHYSILWQKKNPDKMKMYKLKIRSTLKGRLNERMSCNIRRSLKKNKSDRSWKILVGYTLDDLTKRLKKTMPAGYTWKDFMEGRLDIDHIIPKSAFNYSQPEHLDFKKCWGLENLQLLPRRKNRKKGYQLEQPFQPSFKF